MSSAQAMAQVVTITFSLAGTKSPVYLVTSMSEKPWELLEMSIADKANEFGELVFFRDFFNIAPGTYEYKVRIGNHVWVVDATKETATDPDGHKNNVICVCTSSVSAFTSPTRFTSNERTIGDNDAVDTAAADIDNVAGNTEQTLIEDDSLSKSKEPMIAMNSGQSSKIQAKDAEEQPPLLPHEMSVNNFFPSSVMAPRMPLFSIPEGYPTTPDGERLATSCSEDEPPSSSFSSDDNGSSNRDGARGPSLPHERAKGQDADNAVPERLNPWSTRTELMNNFVPLLPHERGPASSIIGFHHGFHPLRGNPVFHGGQMVFAEPPASYSQQSGAIEKNDAFRVSPNDDLSNDQEESLCYSDSLDGDESDLLFVAPSPKVFVQPQVFGVPGPSARIGSISNLDLVTEDTSGQTDGVEDNRVVSSGADDVFSHRPAPISNRSILSEPCGLVRENTQPFHQHLAPAVRPPEGLDGSPRTEDTGENQEARQAKRKTWCSGIWVLLTSCCGRTLPASVFFLFLAFAVGILVGIAFVPPQAVCQNAQG
ncbi:hypothetical protein B0J11DRAFT_594213 [Dendryphion nanum]|uniref:AMP-activated protein kinase glycogen-binding domain-containing protein n=1 Tax=Dendryphion nanum TaxID=256645 RepID=A0A9P9ID12_9PLEO|nr:hypothetical protein B0J11DRAFT_594213 [Dendryphion nanum]